MALVLNEVGAAQAPTFLEQAGDAADLTLNGLAARLGRMRGENRMELQAREQLGCFGSAHLIGELMERHGEGVRRSTASSVETLRSRSRRIPTR